VIIFVFRWFKIITKHFPTIKIKIEI